jgi:hypothetical protein
MSDVLTRVGAEEAGAVAAAEARRVADAFAATLSAQHRTAFQSHPSVRRLTH